MTAVNLLDTLSPRERAVLVALMDGLTAKEIAAAQYVSVNTVRSQVSWILLKLNVNSQIAAVAYANRTLLGEGYHRHLLAG